MKTATQQVGIPQRHGVGWLVPSSSGTGTYYVEITEGTVRCTCPSWVYRRTQVGGDCKHIRRVMAMNTEVTMV
jgi:hypothetical protein